MKKESFLGKVAHSIAQDKKGARRVADLQIGAPKSRFSEGENQLPLDVYQTDTDIVITLIMAGVRIADIDIAITNDILTIKGVRVKNEEVKQRDYYYQECYWGPFSRSVIVPAEIKTDLIKASLKNGILTIRLPKEICLKK